MSYAVWSGYRNEVITIYPGMDHAHSKGQKECQMCVQNQIAVIAKGIYRWVKNYALIRQLNIQSAMIKMFEPPRNKTKPTVLQPDGAGNKTSGKHRRKTQN